MAGRGNTSRKHITHKTVAVQTQNTEDVHREFMKERIQNSIFLTLKEYEEFMKNRGLKSVLFED